MPPTPSLSIMFIKLAYVFMKIGLLTVGGGLAMIPIVQQEMETRGWLSHQQFLDILGISQITPGPMAVNTATFVGYRVIAATYPHSNELAVLGALCCTIAVCMPSLFCVNLFGAYWVRHREHPCLKHVFYFLKPIVTGLVLTAALSLLISALWGGAETPSQRMFHIPLPDTKATLIAISAFLLTAYSKTSPVLVLIGGIVSGLLFL